MRPRLNSAAFVVLLATGLAVLSLGVARLAAAEPSPKFELQLIWGTNDSKSPNPKHKPVEPEIRKKLNELPLKWNHYFEVNRKSFVVPVFGVKKETLSKQCALEVRNLGGARVEVCLFGRGEKVVRRSQDLPDDELLVLGGNAPNATAWLVVLKRVK